MPFGEYKVLSNITPNFKQGENVGVLGLNGAGKTTYMNLLTVALQQKRVQADCYHIAREEPTTGRNGEVISNS